MYVTRTYIYIYIFIYIIYLHIYIHIMYFICRRCIDDLGSVTELVMIAPFEDHIFLNCSMQYCLIIPK